MSKKENIDDIFLIKKLQAGDKSVLTLLVKKWHKLFCEKSYWLVKDRDAAKDITQESWIIIIDKIDTLEKPKQFKFWAYRIVINKSTDWLRAQTRQRKKTITNNTDIKDEKSDYSEKEQLKLCMSKAIRNLPYQQKLVIQLFYTEAYSLKQISEMLDISVGTVKSRLFHAREKLKTILKTRNYEN